MFPWIDFSNIGLTSFPSFTLPPKVLSALKSSYIWSSLHCDHSSPVISSIKCIAKCAVQWTSWRQLRCILEVSAHAMLWHSIRKVKKKKTVTLRGKKNIINHTNNLQIMLYHVSTWPTTNQANNQPTNQLSLPLNSSGCYCWAPVCFAPHAMQNHD